MEEDAEPYLMLTLQTRGLHHCIDAVELIERIFRPRSKFVSIEIELA